MADSDAPLRLAAGGLDHEDVVALLDEHLAEMRLETGTQDHVAPARRLYERHGFTEVGPFGDYRRNPNSAFYSRDL